MNKCTLLLSSWFLLTLYPHFVLKAEQDYKTNTQRNTPHNPRSPRDRISRSPRDRISRGLLLYGHLPLYVPRSYLVPVPLK